MTARMGHSAILSGGVAPLAWSTTFKGPNVVTSSLDSRISKAASGWESAIGNRGYDSGKRQFEIQSISNAVFCLAGAANADFASFSDFAGSSSSTSGSGSIGYHFQNGSSWLKHLENNTSSNGAHGNEITTADVLTIGLDFVTDVIVFYKNGTLVLTASGFTSMGSKLWYPAGSTQQGSIVFIRGTGLAHPISGFTNWDD